MSPAEQAYHDHLARRPELPRPYDPASKAAKEHQRELQAWVDQLERLESAVRLQGFALEPKDQVPRCLPKSDYQWRDLDEKPRKRKRPAWSGATPEYNRQKARERRARVKAEREAKIRESMAERKIA